MGISKPIVVYDAENNVEAKMLCDQLKQNGIEAHVTLDESVVGLGPLGMLPGIHKPQIWIDRSNVDAATVLLAEYERDRSRRQSQPDSPQDADSTVGVICEDCGKKTLFPVSKRGTVQDCSHCGAYVDVGDEPQNYLDS